MVKALIFSCVVWKLNFLLLLGSLASLVICTFVDITITITIWSPVETRLTNSENHKKRVVN